MADVELTEIQTRIYEAVTEKEPISKKKLMAALALQARTIGPPIKALVDRGVLVTDEYGDYAIAAGVREEMGNGYVSVPMSEDIMDELNPAPTPRKSRSTRTKEPDVPVMDDDVDDEEEDNLYNDYWKKHPEELVTHYHQEGLDALKRHALKSAMQNAVGVGAKAVSSALHWFDIDEDVRRDPTTLMRALEDAGVKHTMVGRIARETFLPEKQYGPYLQNDQEPYIDRGRPNQRRRTPSPGHRSSVDEYDEYDDQPASRSRRRSHDHDDEMPWWAESIVQRLDALDGGDRRSSYEPERGSPYNDEIKDQMSEQNATIAKLRETLLEHETDRKIASAMDPLLSKITGLEKRDPMAKAGMSDEQFKLQTDKEIFQDISATVDNTVTSLIEPIMEGISSVQKMQAMREIIDMERVDDVAPGTYLKYMTGGNTGGDPITRDRIGNTIDMIKNKAGAR